MNDKDGDQGHGTYVRRVLDDSQRYAQDLLQKNSALRTALVTLQVREQHLQQELQALRAEGGQANELRARLRGVEQEAQTLRDELAHARAAVEANTRDQERLEVLVRQVHDDNRRYNDEFAQLQQQTNNLANLYVASYSLHGSLDPRRLVEVTEEIVANLIGSEEMAFFGIDRGRGTLVLLGAVGVDPERYRSVPLEQGLIGAAVRSGRPLVVEAGDARGSGEETLTAVVPLRLVDRVIGAIAIFRLLPQKPAFEDLDRELFDLLASHAGMAFHCAELHARFAAETASAAAPPQ